MSEEKLLFVEKELKRWKRPESPKPGTVHVFFGEGKQPLIVGEGERGPTQGELVFGKYGKFYYEVDMGDRSLNFYEKLLSYDNIEFHAEVELTYAVNDNPAVQAPALVVRRARTDAGQFLKNLAIEVMRRTSRRYRHEQSGDAENAIAARIEEEVRDNGFKLSRPAFVKLSLDERFSTLLKDEVEATYIHTSRMTQIAREAEQDELQKELKLRSKQKRAEFYVDKIKSGDWETLLAMLDPNDPEDGGIRMMLNATLEQLNSQEERERETLKYMIENGLIEQWQLDELSHSLLNKEVSGLPKQSIAFLEDKLKSSETEDSQEVEDVKPSIPDEISRDTKD